ncbi:phosphoglycerate mutase family protein [alpha proteobacterium HIMB5]|nr:phosphoglycerate mutase family protein [alpha proteobacterium HIMB5]
MKSPNQVLLTKLKLQIFLICIIVSKMRNKLIKYFKLIFLTLSFIIVLSSSLIYLYDKRYLIINKFNFIILNKDTSDYSDPRLLDEFWANEILKGGYILHLRHADHFWVDVRSYDALEAIVHSNDIDIGRNAENDYLAKAVCLNERGKIQARAMGEHFKYAKVPISYVISSVSCRSRQTAKLAFGGYNKVSHILNHPGIYNEEFSSYLKKIKKFYLNLPVSNDSNLVVSSDNGVITPLMFENNPPSLRLDEGGFSVISIKNNKLYFEHEFRNFSNFSRVFYKR